MLKRGQWSVEELTKLRECFGRRPLVQLARELRRTPETVRQKAEQLFEGRSRSGEWTPPELEALRRMVGISDVETMALVAGRSRGEVLERLRGWAGRTRRGRFQRWETDYLKECYSSRPDWAVGLVTGRSMASIRKRARELCLGKDRRLESVPIPELEKIVEIQPQPRSKMPRWTDEEVAILQDIYPETPNLEVARVLRRSVKSVIAKANALDLKKSTARLRAMGRENVAVRHERPDRSRSPSGL